MHPLSLLITVLLVALVVFLVVYLWRQYLAEQKTNKEELKRLVRDEVQNYFTGMRLKDEIEDLRKRR